MTTESRAMIYFLAAKRVVANVILILIGWFISITVTSAHIGTEQGHIWEDWGSGHMTFGIVPMALFWLGLIVAVVLLIRWATKTSSNTSTPKEKPAIDILKERFARGEIDKQEFEEMKRILTN